MQTKNCFTGARGMFSRSKQVLDLEFLASNTGRFIPVYLSHAGSAICQAHASDSFALASAASSIAFP
jgi:hypothetical protein